MERLRSSDLKSQAMSLYFGSKHYSNISNLERRGHNYKSDIKADKETVFCNHAFHAIQDLFSSSLTLCKAAHDVPQPYILPFSNKLAGKHHIYTTEKYLYNTLSKSLSICGVRVLCTFPVCHLNRRKSEQNVFVELLLGFLLNSLQHSQCVAIFKLTFTLNVPLIFGPA